ncbi:MAG TPA: MurR/RpiR family transcriptional regulator [Burkholderiaceae bacterium]|nr:MurR/RpiR family transcriptional regulator [Burkholderiaceae bacterium]
MQSLAVNSARPRPPSRPGSYDDLARRITERFPRMPGQLQRIARFALDAPEDFALGTAAQLAEQIGVQPSALVRFAAAVDCDGFAELRQLFRTQLRARTLTYRERIERLQSRAPKATSPGAVFRVQVQQAIAGLQSFQHALDDRLLTQAVELMATASQINLLAARRSFPVAAYLAYALNQLEVRTQLLDNVGGMNREFAARIEADEVVIAISFRNYTDEIIEIADSCRKRGAAVIAVTDSKLSPLMRVATLAFAIGDDGGAAFRSLVEPIVLAQSLVVAVGHRLMAERAQRRTNSHPARRSDAKKRARR